MGGAVSSGRDNEELVDNLCYEDYICSPDVERVFRMIDRADYMSFREEDDRIEAYEDHAWRRGTLHLSAPCIYTRALEALKLKKGVSFLHIGSGTGYFSTMAGVLIGPYGINHGIEIYESNVEYAHEKLEQFRKTSYWYDPVEFCEPLFVVGNGLLVCPGGLLYDRVYCAAACPPEHAQLLKNLLSVGGLLVMPHENQLECVCRVNATEWRTDVILPSVSFAPLILPSNESIKDLAALEMVVEPHLLKDLCRLAILSSLGRSGYCKISQLPLPQHLKEFVSCYQQWGDGQQQPPPPPLKSLCPIDRSKQEVGGASSPPERRHGNQSGFSHRLGLQQMGNDRVIVCNFNGMLLQLPIESDDDNQSGRGSDGSRDDGIRDDNEDGSHDEGIHDDGVHDDEDGSQDDGIQEDEDGSHDDGCHGNFYDVEEGDPVIGDEEMDQSDCSEGASEEF